MSATCLSLLVMSICGHWREPLNGVAWDFQTGLLRKNNLVAKLFQAYSILWRRNLSSMLSTRG